MKRLLVLALLALPLVADDTAFFKAISANDVATVRTMLAADPALANAHSVKGRSAVTVALFINVGEGFLDPHSNEILQMILALKPPLDLFETAAIGERAQLEKMLKSDPSAATKRSSFGWTLLHLSAFGGNVPNTELLLAKGADVSARAQTKFLNTPLQTALLSGQYATAKLLLDHGADALVRQAQGFAPMHEAAILGRKDLVQLLLDHGAELNSRSDSGLTPLAEALRGKHEECAQWMKAKGAVIEPVADID
ncbi:MAG TPA: ankyrin repeat domain-containing protein [Thermoanaerobaculia bacterium]|nr:ankyrin repeat domain-containing protein [Thermoanaerobaculia bacterium]